MKAMDAPQQLAQYYMMVTCKWRLAALLCFLKTHQHQKVMVFFSTCDSVDYHALLFRETEWPQDLDAPIEGQPGDGDTNGHTQSSGGNNNNKNSKNNNNSSYKNNDNINSNNSNVPDGFSTYNSNSNSNNFIEPLPSRFTGMFGDECYMYRLHGNVPQNVRQTVYKDFCKAKSGIMLCTGLEENFITVIMFKFDFFFFTISSLTPI